MVPSCIQDLKKRILPWREQARITDEWLKFRLENILPDLMEREEIDFWVIIAREYNEDPVVLSLMPAAMLSARRRTILAFHRHPDGRVERLNLGKSDPVLNEFYSQAWDPEKEEQWTALAREIKDRNPAVIGLNYSEHFALGDGLTRTQYDQFTAALDQEQRKKIKSAARLAIGWLEKRSQPEIQVYDGINKIAHGIIARAYSPAVIHPGITTAADVAWWMRQAITDIGLQAWFQPTVAVQRRGKERVTGTEAIIPGDVLHCDIGMHYLDLATDTQQMAYVLEPGSSSHPPELEQALASGNRLQDIFTANFKEGRAGNEIFLESLEQARAEGIKASIYTHPIGIHGHGAGPTMGLFDRQEFIPFTGEYPLHDDTCYAIELNIKQEIEAWDNQEIMIALEQTAAFTGGSVIYLGGRQTGLHLI